MRNPLAGSGPSVEEARRAATGTAKDGRSNPVIGDPTIEGATLRVVVNGTVASDETYALDASGWSRVGAEGFRFRNSDALPQPVPVKSLVIKNTAKRTFLLFDVVLSGREGTEDLELLPASTMLPPPGVQGDLVDAWMSLQLGPSGNTYCVRLGGASGGVITADSAKSAKIVASGAAPANTSQGCP